MGGESETIPKITVLFYMTGMTSSTHSTWKGPRRYFILLKAVELCCTAALGCNQVLIVGKDEQRRHR